MLSDLFSVSRSVVIPALSAAILAGCGGGSGDAAPSSSLEPIRQQEPVHSPAPAAPVKTQPADPVPVTATATFNISSAIASFLLTPSKYTLTAIDANGDEYVTSVEHLPVGSLSNLEISPDRFNTAPSVSKMTVNGKSLMIEWGGPRVEDFQLSTMYYRAEPFSLLGFNDNMGMSEKVAESFTPPETAQVGDSGILAVLLKEFVNQTTSEERVIEWSLDAATADTAWFCINERTRVTVGTESTMSDLETKECARVTPNGTVQGYKADMYGKNGEVRLRFR